MDQATVFQLQLMDVLKKHLPANKALPALLAELLNLRMSSTYQRIRAERILPPRELELILKHFHIDATALSSTSELTTAFYSRPQQEQA